jgi:hypothetical protein
MKLDIARFYLCPQIYGTLLNLWNSNFRVQLNFDIVQCENSKPKSKPFFSTACVMSHYHDLHLIQYCVKSTNYKFNITYFCLVLNYILSTFSFQNRSVLCTQIWGEIINVIHVTLTYLHTEIHDQPVICLGYHCWQLRSSAVMLVETSSH